MSDVITKGLSRLAYQFNDSEKFKGFVAAFLEQYQDLEDSNQQLLTLRYLDTAEGKQLDGIGEIVGIERPRLSNDITGAFGFDGDETSRGFTDLFNTELGGNFVSFGSEGELIGDDRYRLLIRARIIRNQTNMTVDETTRLISFTFSNVPVRYSLPTNLSPQYEIYKYLDTFETSLIDDLPLMIGLGDVTYITADENSFSFAEDPIGLGFGDINDSEVGGNFAKIL